MEISLYRRYRPQRFSEVAGQSAAVGVVTGSLERSRVGHAYLFSGPRGCGKTTVARLLAKALNCLAPVNGYEPCCECENCLAITAGESLDVVEIDGASNNGVDEVRELKSHVALTPFASRYKVYIIDEVHMLSLPAFNALLKTLEEPPGHVVFILATTEAHKVPVTIRSRCQHIPFRRIETGRIYDRLAEVCAAESIECEPEALRELARQADGALRDALSMLEQLSGLGGERGISLSDVEAALGQGSRSSLERWLASWQRGEAEIFFELDRMLAGGASPQRFVEELFALVRDLWLTARWKNIPDALDASEQEKEYLRTEAPLWSAAELEAAMRFLAGLLPQVRMGMRIDVLSGLLMTKMARLKEEVKEEISGRQVYASPVSPSIPSPASSSMPSSSTVSGSFGPQNISPPSPPSSLPPSSFPFSPSVPSMNSMNEKDEKADKKIDAPAPSVPSASDSAPAAPLNPDDWTPCGEESRNEILKTLREGNFPLHCAMTDARFFTDGNAAPARLILDAAHRYCYEFSKLDRNRSLLKELLAPLFEGCEILLRHKEQWISCEMRAASGAKKKTSERRAASDKNVGNSEPDLLPPEPWMEFSQMEASQTEQPGQARPERARPGEGGIPFAGLVREVQRWMQGSVLLVRRGGEDDDPADELPSEE